MTKTHLKHLLQDPNRNACLRTEFNDVILDFTHQKIDLKTMNLLAKVTEESKVFEKIDQMFGGEKINSTE